MQWIDKEEKFESKSQDTIIKTKPKKIVIVLVKKILNKMQKTRKLF